MRIAIDARFVTDHFPGIGRYVYNLLINLAEINSDHTIFALYNPKLPNSRYDLARLNRYSRTSLIAVDAPLFSLIEQIRVPRMLHHIQADIYHSPYYVRPYANLPCSSVVTIHDVIPHLFPEYVSLRARLLFELLIRLAIRSSQRIIAISTNTYDDLVKVYDVPLNKLAITPFAVDAYFRPQSAEAIASLRKKYDLPERYVLSFSSNKPHKNFVNLIEAWAQLQNMAIVGSKAESRNDKDLIQYKLVVAGHWDPRYPESYRKIVEYGLMDSVKFIHNVAEADLPALYSGAELFAFPSIYEGFGLPPLEAMACGVPVLCCNTSSLPEIVGDAAIYVEPESHKVASGLKTALEDSVLRASLREAGSRRVKKFSWRRTAEMTKAVYESLTE